MPILLWSDDLRDFEGVSDDGLAEDIRAMRELWAAATPEERAELLVLIDQVDLEGVGHPRSG